MASSNLLISMLLLISVFFILTNPTHSSPSNNISSPTKKPNKVKLNLYYETLCPYCKIFIVKKLSKVFTTDLNSIVKFRLVPYGNAKLVQPGPSITCQHGEDECYLNAIHACAINIWPKPAKHFEFIHCVEETVETKRNSTQQVKTVWKSCAKNLKDVKYIEDCYASGKAKKLIVRYANETANLSPPKKYVPWLTVNNKPLYDDYEDFVGEVCKAYKGEDVPKACEFPTPATKAGTTKLDT